MKHFRMHLLVLLAAVGFLVLNQVGTAIGQVAVPRDKAVALQQQGNYKEAYDSLSVLALDPKDDPLQVGSDLTNAVQCLQNLGALKRLIHSWRTSLPPTRITGGCYSPQRSHITTSSITDFRSPGSSAVATTVVVARR